MKFLKIFIPSVIAFLLMVTYSESYAQSGDEQENKLYIGPQLGIFNAKDADDPNVMAGAAIRWNPSTLFGIEGSINYKQEEYFNNTITAKSWPVMVTALIYPIPLAYGSLGAGWYNTNLTYNNTSLNLNTTTETKQKFGWHFGAGIELPVGTFGKLVGDLRYVFLDYDFQDLPGSSGETADYYVFMIGFLIKL